MTKDEAKDILHVSLPIDEFDIKEGEVIGNIHDNPELMEVER